MKPETAFDQWLMRQPRRDAVIHVLECLRSGGELAWDLMERAHGPRWRCSPEELPGLINEAIERLGTQQETQQGDTHEHED